MYEVIDNDFSKFIKLVNADSSETWIPMDEANSDYQAYLQWLEAQDAAE
jgi:hypothetical protein